MRHALLGCIGAVAVTVLTSSPAAADPALWKAHGKGDVYLFGSVHVLPKDVNWHTPAIDAALDSAKVIVLEVSSDELLDLSLTLGGIYKFGRLPAGQTISSQLPPDKAARFREIVTKANLPFERVDALRPWLVAMSLGQMSKKRKVEGGYYELDQEVWTAGGVLSDKEIRGLETLDEHFRVLSDLSKSEELRFFVSALDAFGKPPIHYHEIVEAWQHGDTATLAKFTDEDEGPDAEFHNRLLTNRNAK